MANSPISATVQVDLGDRSYPIYIGSGQLSDTDVSRFVAGNKALIVTNTTVAPLYMAQLQSQLQFRFGWRLG